MTFKELAKELAKREGKKESLSIAQISEVLARLVDIVEESPAAVLEVLFETDLVMGDCLAVPLWGKRMRIRKGKRK